MSDKGTKQQSTSVPLGVSLDTVPHSTDLEAKDQFFFPKTYLPVKTLETGIMMEGRKGVKKEGRKREGRKEGSLCYLGRKRQALQYRMVHSLRGTHKGYGHTVGVRRGLAPRCSGDRQGF